MEQFNKKIKDIYDQEQSSLPTELKWDEMKAGIFEKMKEEQDDEPAPVFAFWFGQKKWWLAIAVLLVAFTSVSIYLNTNQPIIDQSNSNKKNLTEKILNENLYQKTTQQKDQESKSISENNATSKPGDLISGSINETTTKPTAINNDVINSPANEKIRSNNEFSSSATKHNLTKKPISSILNDEKAKTSNATVLVTEENTDELESTKIIPSKHQSSSKNESINVVSKIDEAITSTNFTEDFKVVDPLKKKVPGLESLNESLVLKAIDIPIIKKPAEQNESYNSLQLDAGLTYLFSMYQKSNSNQYKTEKGFPSNYINISYQRIFTNKIYVSTGLSFSRFKTKFDLSDKIMHTYLVKNAHTLSIENIVTGKTTDVFEDVEIAAPSQRRVRHYNHFDELSIPIIVGKHFKSKKFTYNIGLGSEVSLYTSSKGKTLRANKVINYAKTNALSYQNKVQVSTLLELGAGFTLNKQFEIIANLRHKNYLLNWANDGLTVKPQALLLGAGLRYKF